MRHSPLCVPLVAALLAGAPAAAAQTPTRIRLGTLAPQGTSYHRILQSMGERWRTATNGQVQLTVYAGTMGSEAELIRRMRLGQLQAGALTVMSRPGGSWAPGWRTAMESSWSTASAG